MAAPTAGSKIRASGVPLPYLLSAAASSSLVQSTTAENPIPGATLTFTTVHANANVQVTGIFDVTTTTAGTGTATGHCQVDGADQANQAIWFLVTASARATIAQSWSVTLAAAGSHTIKLLGMLNAASGVCTFSPTHTTISALVLDY